jgi:glutathione-independent formaldehyde dehydrogenase
VKALVYKGPFEVAVEEVPDPTIEAPTDVVVQVTSTCICGSDLHMYEGRTGAEPGIVFGHENQGVVVEVGPGVATVKQGDRVNLPFNVGCGFCFNCERGYTGFCLTVNPGFAGGAYGYVSMGPYRGGQAEYLRVPFADWNCLQLPKGTEHEADFAMLSDIFPTGYHGAHMAGVTPGDTVAVFGAGPVGIMAAYSSLIKGASEVYVVDRVPERLKAAEHIGAVPVDFSQGDPAQQIKDLRGGDGVLRGIDAVGYQAVGHSGGKPSQDGAQQTGSGDVEQANVVLEGLIDVVNPTGRLGIPGLYVPSDPGGADEATKQGRLALSFGKLFEKGLSLATGQANVKNYNRYLRDLIIAGRAEPSLIVSHEIALTEAPEAYDKFDKRIDGYTKVILHPQAA